MSDATSPSGHDSGIAAVRQALGDRYTIERELGRGGMGTVYLARDIKLDRPVALKVLPEEFASQVALRDRFLQETRTAAKFSHPNIVPVYAVEDANGILAYAMGLVEGETLAERVARMGPLPVREIVKMLQDVGYALAYAHGRGVVHRDIKPDNIMIERATGRALVMDFGISRTMTQAVHTAALTRVGEVVGTPEYMSPEQASGDVVDGRSDLYSLGLTAHYTASGHTAVTGESTQKILVKQLTERVSPVADVRPDLPDTLAAAIDRCVEKDPAARFATAEALVEAIDAAQLAEPEIPVPVRLFAGEVGMLSTIAIGIALYGLFLSSTDQALLDILIPMAGLAAVLFMRTLTTLSEARRLAVAGFTASDIMSGFQRVVAERASRRAELRADADTQTRRKKTLRIAVAMFAFGVALAYASWRMRIPLGQGNYGNSYAGITMVFSGVIMMGMGFVLLMRSPFRMPIGERLFRVIWLGAVGRAFVRYGTRGVKQGVARVAQPKMRAAQAPAPKLALTRGPANPPAPPPQADRLTDLERRVSVLERKSIQIER